MASLAPSPNDRTADFAGSAKATALPQGDYTHACQLAASGELTQSRVIYHDLLRENPVASLHALIENDLATLDVLDGNLPLAHERLLRATTCDPDCITAQENLAFVESEFGVEPKNLGADKDGSSLLNTRRPRVAIVSLLFNWPSTGGGTIHTAETGQFLQLAGYDVRHLYVQYAEWGLGQVTAPLAVPSEALVFDSTQWNALEIQRRVRQAVDAFGPDYVIITDSWNFKPLLAEAVQGYPYFLRLAAQEGLCPLNNVRLLVSDAGEISACPQHQLATPDVCRKCVSDRQHYSGSLHQAERELAGFGTAEYDRKLRQAFFNAEVVLVVNPLIAAMVGPYARQVRVVPSGFDPQRFPWTDAEQGMPVAADRRIRLLFAGLPHEYMKGYHILRQACYSLWQDRRDFELVVTGDLPEQPDPFCRYIGWQTQERLPHEIRAADILVFPTIAEEALGRSAVEAMGSGRPVIASRIGGLQFTVTDGATGLLFEPGNADDLARQIKTLLDDPDLRQRLGRAGRKRFEEHFTWDSIIARHYRPLLHNRAGISG